MSYIYMMRFSVCLEKKKEPRVFVHCLQSRDGRENGLVESLALSLSLSLILCLIGLVPVSQRNSGRNTRTRTQGGRRPRHVYD